MGLSVSASIGLSGMPSARRSVRLLRPFIFGGIDVLLCNAWPVVTLVNRVVIVAEMFIQIFIPTTLCVYHRGQVLFFDSVPNIKRLKIKTKKKKDRRKNSLERLP